MQAHKLHTKMPDEGTLSNQRSNFSGGKFAVPHENKLYIAQPGSPLDGPLS